MEKVISAADANRSFSQVLREVRHGQSYLVTSHGRAVARIAPVENDRTASAARKLLFERLRSQRVSKIGRWKRQHIPSSASARRALPCSGAQGDLEAGSGANRHSGLAGLISADRDVSGGVISCDRFSLPSRLEHMGFGDCLSRCRCRMPSSLVRGHANRIHMEWRHGSEPVCACAA